MCVWFATWFTLKQLSWQITTSYKASICLCNILYQMNYNTQISK